MRSAAALLIASWFLTACVPSLSDGRYSCARDGLCPEGWSCWADGLCRMDVEPDAGLGDLAPCSADSQCGSGVCAQSWDLTVPSDRAYCSTSCSGHDDCDDYGSNAFCVDGACRQGCMAPPDCPDGTRCHLASPRRATPFDGKTCLAVEDRALDGHVSCSKPEGMAMPSCNAPAWCMFSEAVTTTGVCAMRCLNDMDCPFDGTCTEVLSDASLCLFECTSDEDCDGLSCLSFGGGSQTFCVPPEWDGMTTLPGTFMDTWPAPAP